MNIVFMGTPEFAVPCLQKLIDLKHNITGVFTQPDKPKGRHAILTPPPVKELALSNNLTVYQPLKMRDGTALDMIKEANPDLIIVVAYGKILPKEILEFPKYGCINIHASLLPKLRGAAPIQWAILNGFDKTGVTSMKMDEGLDTGDMLISREISIDENENCDSLHDRLSLLGADTLEETLRLLEENKLNPIQQDHSIYTYAPILTKDLSPIDWNESAKTIHNKIRGLFGWPCATAEVEGKKYKINKSIISEKQGSYPGEIIIKDNKLFACCGDLKCIEILEIQPESKKNMSASDFLRGNQISSKKFS